MFWKEYCETIKDMTRTSKQGCLMDACWNLNRALLDLYQAKDKTCKQKEFNRYAGYVLHYVVLLDLIAVRNGNEVLDYYMDDSTLVDPIDKIAILNIASSLSGLAREYYFEKRANTRAYQTVVEWDKFEWSASIDTTRMLVVTLTRILRYIKSNTDLSLREIATQHVDIFYGREPPPARGYDLEN